MPLLVDTSSQSILLYSFTLWYTRLLTILTLPMKKKYIVRLTEAERSSLESLIHKGKEAAYKRLHAETA